MDNEFVQVAIKCASCGAIRGETNHWWAVWLNKSAEMNGLMLAAPKTTIRVSRWDDESGDYPYIEPACGESCLLRLVSKSLAAL